MGTQWGQGSNREVTSLGVNFRIGLGASVCLLSLCFPVYKVRANVGPCPLVLSPHLEWGQEEREGVTSSSTVTLAGLGHQVNVGRQRN